MSRQSLMLIAAGGSFTLLAGAFLFQLAGYPPCAMCIWQRWPHAAAIAVGILAILIPWRILAVVGAGAAAITSGIGIYHTGVERDLWEGPTSCTGSGLGGMSGADLLSLDAPKLVMCDQVSWELLGLSMASWNALASAGLAVIWIIAALTTKATSQTG